MIKYLKFTIFFLKNPSSLVISLFNNNNIIFQISHIARRYFEWRFTFFKLISLAKTVDSEIAILFSIQLNDRSNIFLGCFPEFSETEQGKRSNLMVFTSMIDLPRSSFIPLNLFYTLLFRTHRATLVPSNCSLCDFNFLALLRPSLSSAVTQQHFETLRFSYKEIVLSKNWR